MSNTRRILLVKALKLFDMGLIILAFLVASLVVLKDTHNVSGTQFFSMRVKIQNFVIFSIFIWVWQVTFRFVGLYNSRRLSTRRREIIDVIAATSLGTVAVLAGATIFRIKLVTPLFLFVFWAASTVSIASGRLVLRVFLAFIRKRGRNLRDILIVGTNRRALAFASRLASHPELGYHIIGFVDQDWHGLDAFHEAGYAVVSDLADFQQYLRNNIVDEVVLALPFRSMHEDASRIAATCEEQGVTVRVFNNIFDLRIAHSSTEELEGDPVITHSTDWADGWAIVTKRILDLTGSFIALIFLSPLILAVAILIKLTAPGPVFFIQKRVGLHKRPFNLYKFRTMVVGAEDRISEIEHLNEVGGPVFKVKNDPRITPFGKILRKTSIDELPQLFNVMKGEMSLVGPRPLPVRDYKGFDKDWQRRRFSVRPGITCLWQVRGRSTIPFERWMELDLQYIERWSLWLDFEILVRTIPAVLKGSGAT